MFVRTCVYVCGMHWIADSPWQGRFWSCWGLWGRRANEYSAGQCAPGPTRAAAHRLSYWREAVELDEPDVDAMDLI